MEFLKAIKAVLSGERLGSAIDLDESVVFFPTAACRSGKDAWEIPIHGWIYQPTELSRLRRIGVHVVKRTLRLKVKRSDPAMPLFRQRMGALLVDNERWERIRIRLGESVFTLNRSRANGHFHGKLELQAPEVNRLLETAGKSGSGEWLTFKAVTRSDDPRIFDGRVLLLDATGVSVISDIDDTIKVTEVRDRKRLLQNTFLNAFTCVPEMAGVYQRWQKELGAAFHYVSATPWHLYPCLAEFLGAQGFPAGTFHMRTFRLLGRDLARAFDSSRRVKSRHIKELLACYPERRFILVGDSGESDPEMYGEFAKKHPKQIERIYIRNVTGESGAEERWEKAFSGFPRWKLFRDACEVA